MRCARAWARSSRPRRWRPRAWSASRSATPTCRSGVIIGAIVRDGEVIIPRGDTVIRAKDRVILFAAAEAVKKVEKLFSVRLEFF